MDLKIRIFALAKELGLDSKVLIEYCNNAGIQIKNSALASISPEEKDVLLKYLDTIGKGGEQSSGGEMLAPVRETTRDVGGKIRSIKAMVPRPQNGKGKRDDETSGADTATAEPEAAPEAAPAGEPAGTDTAPAAAQGEDSTGDGGASPLAGRGPLRRGAPAPGAPGSAPMRPEE